MSRRSEGPMSEPLPVEPTNGAGVMPDDPPQDGIDQDPQPKFAFEVIE
jgi:hypothetical protein